MLSTNLSTSSLSFIFLISTSLFFISATTFKDGITEDLLKYTNQFRRSKGLTALEMRDDLNAIARKHSEDMASGRRSFGHGGYNQRVLKVQKIIKPFSGNMAENVLYGAGNAKDAVSIWKKSSGHKKNMLGDYKYIGIGTARNRRGIIYYTEIFVK